MTTESDKPPPPAEREAAASQTLRRGLAPASPGQHNQEVVMNMRKIVAVTNLGKYRSGPEKDALAKALARIMSGNARIQPKRP